MNNSTTVFNRSVYCQRVIPYIDNVHSKAVLATLYATVIAISVCGNSLVVYVITTNKSMRCVTNLFILNLACSDLLQTTCSCWLTPLYMYMGHWVFGALTCYLLPMAQGTAIFVSTLTLTAIAVDRYVVILNPHRTRMHVRHCLAIICSIWAVSIVLVLPYAINMEQRYYSVCDVYICAEKWNTDELRKAYGAVVLCLQFVVPFIIVGVCYTKIGWFLSHRVIVGEGKRMNENERQRRRKAHKMLVSMVVIFCVCWLPWNSLNVARDLGLSHLLGRLFIVLFIGAHLTAMSATGWNAVLYAWMNDTFRKEFRAALPCFGRSARVQRRGSFSRTITSRHVSVALTTAQQTDVINQQQQQQPATCVLLANGNANLLHDEDDDNEEGLGDVAL